MGMKYWSMDENELMKALDTGESGLSSKEAMERLEKYGENRIGEIKQKPLWKIFLSQFTDTLVVILIISSLISFLLGEHIDGIAILVIVLLNAFIGFYQELSARKSLESIKKMLKKTAKVKRDGRVVEIESKFIVPGDIIILESGDIVPADARIIKSFNLRVNEAVLTGESLPVEKSDSVVETDELHERRNTVFASTVVVSGKAEAVVVATGMETEFGKIAKSLEIEELRTPLQEEMDRFGKKLTIMIFIIIGVVALSEYLKGEGLFRTFLFAISLAVAAVPEGLPAVITITMSLGVKRMAKRNAIVRKLYAVETLGSVDYICTDKTGTLTKNEMTVRKIWVPFKEFEVTGTGYFEEGKIEGDVKEVEELVKAGMYCNDATLNDDSYVGDTTDVALLVLARKAGMERRMKVVDEIPFSSETKIMIAKTEDGAVYVKGAPEVVVDKCSSMNGKPIEKEKILEKVNEYASQGYRVLALAKGKSMDGNFDFLGLVAIIDPPREEVKDAIRIAKEAGIKVVMITGDHLLIAKKIAEEVGIGSNAIEGKQLDKMADEELEEVVEEIDVYARVTPEHKLRVVKALQKKGHVVAATGDGVNDAPALKRADVGIAMGKTGTDVTKEVADMVLADDNFATIVAAIEEGRRIYSNVLKFIKYLLRANLGEILIMFIPNILYLPNPLYPIHLLTINLLTDGMPALALGMDESDRDLMKQKPRKRSERIVTKDFVLELSLAAVVIAAIVLVMFVAYLGTEKAVTMAFATLVMLELTYAVIVKTNKEFANPFSNRALNIANLLSFFVLLLMIYTPLSVFARTVPLSMEDWALIGIAMLVLYLEEEVKKLVWKRR